MKRNNLIYFLPAFISLQGDVRRQKAFMNHVVEPIIVPAEANHDGSLEADDFRKIRQYYGFGVPAIVGEGFCTLRRKAMTDRERTASTFQGALTGLYDDFFDKTGMAKKDILAMMIDPQGYSSSSSLEKLFIQCLSLVLDNIPDPDSFNTAFKRVYEAQLTAERQKSANIDTGEIKRITFNKGGYSLLFYRSVFNNLPDDAEKEAFYQAGALMQLGNDLFDVWKDAPQNILTLVTRCRHIEEVRQVFIEQLNTTIRSIKQTAYPARGINSFLHKFLLAISRCFVCMDQLEGLEQKTRGIFNPSEYSRQEMICDMERGKNMWRSVNYYLNYPL